MFKNFDSPALWQPEDLKKNKDWIFELNNSESMHIARNIKKVFNPKRSFFEYSKDEFNLESSIEIILNAAKKAYFGYGVSLVRGLPRNTLNEEEFRLMIWVIGLYLGVARPQGIASQYISDVRAVGMDYRSASGRGYNSNANLDFHADGCDLVGLACFNKAKEGGQSHISSSTTVWQKLVSERPDLAEIAMEDFYFSHNQEEIPGECPYYVQPLFEEEGGYLFGKWNWNRVRTAQKIKGVPKLTVSQKECINLIEKILRRPDVMLSTWFEPGDLQFINNHVILHSRTSFIDYQDYNKKRLLFRIWLAPPYSIKLPTSWQDFWRSIEPGTVRGGIHGHNYNNICKLFENNQANQFNMPIPNKL
ncbi:TauD/TfdA family dioxygenase [Alphaproteobacteria bacterium]|nr:TauD/TfdA family dioxygenase [Alphaproteobacteria bacterium]